MMQKFWNMFLHGFCEVFYFNILVFTSSNYKYYFVINTLSLQNQILLFLLMRLNEFKPQRNVTIINNTSLIYSTNYYVVSTAEIPILNAQEISIT